MRRGAGDLKVLWRQDHLALLREQKIEEGDEVDQGKNG